MRPAAVIFDCDGVVVDSEHPTLVMIRDDLEAGRLVQLSDLSVLEDHGYHLVAGPGAEGAQARAAQALWQAGTAYSRPSAWAWSVRAPGGCPGR